MATLSITAVRKRAARHPYVTALTTARGRVGLLLVGLVVLAGLLAPLLTSHDPTDQSGDALLGPGSPGHLLGTDDLGRDLLSRVLYGTRTDLEVIAAAVPIGALLGCSLALLAATHPVLDTVVQRLFDLVLAFPGLILALAITAVLGPGRLPVVVVIALVEIPVFGRQLRAGILVQREREYAVAARVGGTGRARLLLRHILPNCADPLVVQVAVSLTIAVFLEGAMSFLGVGVRPPEPTLGGMIGQALPYLAQAPFFAAWPLLTVTLLVLGLSLLSEALNREIRR
ncbi:ABC transporter permease [Streptomyces sp. NL15-2K]|uniref:ABC transporter permease n=1 Tax=Streptomyces sp. NL15-2K TaxID=376149 RepID=UPI000F5750FF|nr:MULTISPECIES: ABC transporter permease [Actinomycetes]WKX13740.1 ABC transporter permease [Kutzneria buriramensis]GCB44853.1 dipeptide transport system permease protein dppC [Streptomyces sp. NL15-2K]